MKHTTLPINGMHCRSCELLLEDEISEVPGVRRVQVSQKKGCAEIYYKGQLDRALVEEKVVGAGYQLKQASKLPWLAKDKEVYNQVAKALTVLIVLFLLGRWSGLFELTNLVPNNFTSLPIVFLVGLTAGVSTCMALIGGLVLGVSAQFAKKHPFASVQEKFTPHLYFQLGRLISFVVLGGVIGFLGSILQLSLTVTGFLIVLVGLSMLIIGAQLLEVFPRLSGWQFTLPKGISRLMGMDTYKQAEYSHKNAAVLGGMTFFLPCGFTQAMQLYAMSTGSITTGALTMGLFALGTAPGLLGIGGLASSVKGTFAQYFYKFSGLVVIFLALFNIVNGLTLTGVDIAIPGITAQGTTTEQIDPNLTMENGIQVVRMTQHARGYSPNIFTIKKDIPVKWVVTSTEPYSCASSLVSKKLNIRTFLEKGENIVEFTPTETGKIQFSCSMGMYAGSFNVIE